MRVLIVAESAEAASAIHRVLAFAPPLETVGLVDRSASCTSAVRDTRPDVIVIDRRSSDDGTLAVIRELRVAAPAAELLLLTTEIDHSWLARAAAAGLDAVVSKAVAPAAFKTLVVHAAAGTVLRPFAPPHATQLAAGTEILTPRELEILRLAAGGASNSRIASELWLAEQTVKFHLSNTYRKLGVANRTEASHYAHVAGLLGHVRPAPLDARAA